MQILQRWVEHFQDGALARLMQDAGHVGFLDYHFANNRFAWRRGMCTLFGMEAAPRGGIEEWYARIREADRARVERELWTACALRRPNATLDYGVAIANGPARFLSSRVCLAYGADGRPLRMSGVTVDVTDRQLDAQRRARDELFATLNHQLRTPLGALSSAAEVLQVLPPASPDAEEARAVVARQTARLAQVLDDLSARHADESPQQAAVHDARPVSRPRKVLVVEDNSDALASLCRKLELDGHEVNTAADGFEGLCRLRALSPEVSIVDIGLPRLNGLDVARYARASGYLGRMIALSGFGAGRDVQSARVAGFDACLVKPVDRGQLRSSLAAD
ncbi:MAG: putative histidine kinase, hybrid [Ramlibacter sp.]|jgi:CheY-like chemotaxis protein|nr:putative histidine kinase, hybrid [Ramlibacter sp.]